MSEKQGESIEARHEQVTELIDAAERGEITRGAFFARAAALGISVAGLGALASSGSAFAASQAVERSVRRVATGVLRVGDNGNGQNDTLNPHKQSAPVDGMRITSLYDRLFVNDSHYRPRPWLAQEVEASRDAKQWTFRLVAGATFHNGAPVTPQDVIFSIRQNMDPKVASNFADFYKPFKGATMRVMDKRTLRLTLKQPFADVPSVLSEAGSNILPQNFDPATANTAPNGNGPFKFVSFTPGQESVFVKNDNYWNSKYPMVDELHILDIPDESARTNALLGGQIDLLTNVSYSIAPTLASRNMRIWQITGNILNVIVLAPDVAPFTWKDQRVREAFALSIDRKQIVSLVYRGNAVVGNDQPIGPSYAYAPVGIAPRKRNIKRAKALLSAAGHPNGVKATMYTADAAPGMLDFATVVARQVKDAGFDITLKKWPSDSFWSDVWLKKDFYTSAWTGRPVPELFLGNTTYTGAAFNEAHIKDKTVDALLTKAKQTTDPKQRTKLYTAAMRRVSDGAQWIVPAYGKLEHASVKGFSWETPPPATSAPYLHNARLT